MLVQTQTWAKKSQASFNAAAGMLRSQEIAAKLPVNGVFPQLTLDLQESNGVSTTQALACAAAARGDGFDQLSLWFSPARIGDAVDFSSLWAGSGLCRPIVYRNSRWVGR